MLALLSNPARRKSRHTLDGTCVRSFQNRIMTTTRFTQINYTLAPLLDQIKLGQIGLPEIQRRNLRTHSQVGNADAGRLSSNGVIPGHSYMAPVR